MAEFSVLLLIICLIVGCGGGIYLIWMHSKLTVAYEDRHHAKVMYDDELGIKGKPDQVLAGKRGYVVVEVKSAVVSKRRRRPYPGDLIQLAAYMQLVSVNMGRVKTGVVRYQNRSFSVKWSRSLQKHLSAIVKGMEQAERDQPPFFKPDRVKCRRCAFSSVCLKASL